VHAQVRPDATVLLRLARRQSRLRHRDQAIGQPLLA
jgi:hypothetical protein